METYELQVTDPHCPDRPPIIDWVLDDQLDRVVAEYRSAGLIVEVEGPVSWQRQLARMENNPDCL